MRYLLALSLLALAACHKDTVAPTECEAVMRRGLHVDTTVTKCR